MIWPTARRRAAVKAAFVHFSVSLLVAFLAAALVFGLWYPYPYRELAGGRELFILVVTVDVICGPLLTLVLFNPAKPRNELWRDLTMVCLIQFAALGYGLYAVWLARPLYLVQEVDRFKVIAALDVESAALAALPQTLKPQLLRGPLVVAIREPVDAQEREKIMFESVQGGRDYSDRPDFYLPYAGAAAAKSLQRAKPLSQFLQKYPNQTLAAQELLIKGKFDVKSLKYLPVIARQDWIAVLDANGGVVGFLKGDGF
jgi:hypothetical protein